MTTKDLARTAMIAAVYAAVSLVLQPFSYGAVQVRIAEALTMLPLIDRKSISGVTLGCFMANLIGVMMGADGIGLIDIPLGTLATFLAANATWKLKDMKIGSVPVPAILMPVVFNFVIIGLELAVTLMPSDIMSGFWIFGAQVGAGELISVILGYVLVLVLAKTKIFEE